MSIYELMQDLYEKIKEPYECALNEDFKNPAMLIITHKSLIRQPVPFNSEEGIISILSLLFEFICYK